MDFTITITGTSALITHNSRLSNPLDPVAKSIKKITKKRIKTDEDYEEMARLEFIGSLYLDPDVGPYLPGENIQRCLNDAGKITRAGMKITRGVFINSDVNPLSYTGPRDPEKLLETGTANLMASVKVGTNRVMRCRPIFREWRVQASGLLDTSILALDELQDIAKTAGLMTGLGDWRPRYGRFSAVVDKV